MGQVPSSRNHEMSKKPQASHRGGRGAAQRNGRGFHHSDIQGLRIDDITQNQGEGGSNHSNSQERNRGDKVQQHRENGHHYMNPQGRGGGEFSSQGDNRSGSAQDYNRGGNVQQHNTGGNVQQHNRGGSAQYHNRGGSAQYHNRGGSAQYHNRGGSAQYHNRGGSAQYHNRGGSAQQHNRGGSVQQNNRGGSVQQHNRGGSVQQHNRGGSVQLHHRGGKGQQYGGREHIFFNTQISSGSTVGFSCNQNGSQVHQKLPQYGVLQNSSKSPQSPTTSNFLQTRGAKSGRSTKPRVKKLNEAQEQRLINESQKMRKPYYARRNWGKKNATVQQSLLSFSRGVDKPRSEILSEDSDDETASTFSRCSSVYGSEESDEDFVKIDSNDSDESEVSSLVSSITSPVEVTMPERQLNSVLTGFKTEVIPCATSNISFGQEECCVAVYWDIENCPVPSKKSAVDIVKKIRDTFYKGRTEDSFTVVCDTRNLDQVIDKELQESQVNVLHSNSENKNAADLKLQNLLQKFQYRQRNRNAAIVLISGDSDFAFILNEMRYMHNIFINLICNRNARKALQTAAQICYFYDEFVSDLPNRMEEETKQCFIIVTNLPLHVEKHVIKNALSAKLASVNVRVCEVALARAEISCSNPGSRNRALKYLQGSEICGFKINVICEDRKYNEKCAKRKKADAPPVSEIQVCSEEARSINSSSKKKEKSKAEISPKENHGKEAAIYIFVCTKSRDVVYWEKNFKEMFQQQELLVEWSGQGLIGYFIVKFKSLSQAQKARKVLEKQQKLNSNAPKFLKLIKDIEGLNLKYTLQEDDVSEKRNKIEESILHVKSIEKKTVMEFSEILNNVKFLNKKNQLGNINVENEEVYVSKILELNQQKVAFLNFTKTTYDKLRALDIAQEINSIVIRVDDLLKDYLRECNCFLANLPIYSKKSVIIRKVRGHQVVIIQAETGSGKSTQICQYLWRDGFAEDGIIVCTQPRKIAAISLAKYVSTQVGCSIGNIVGYQVGLTQKRSLQTKILYVTDFTLLKMCCEDPLLKDVSCIVVDEAHERTVYTDLLLGIIKKCLKERPNLKVLVTSATMNTALFQRYFGLPDDTVLQIAGRTFPIEDIWLQNDMHLGWNYFKKTISVVFEILNQDPGDVLVFLTTPAETEKAVEELNDMIMKRKLKQKLLVLCLHGKLDMAEQQKVFDKTPSNGRKVIFSTNCAETSVTIPGIRYVVDCGMVKEAQYDATRNLNVLSVGFVNKSSAEQRRGRAGRVQSGKCYRLYSKSNYEKEMADTMVPEILRMNLGQALLRLLTLGIKNPLQFDFVEAPPKETLQKAMKQLIHLQAVNPDQGLTDMGSKMSTLPLEPRLSHIVFKGINKEVAYEAIIVAALATVARSIFFRNTENRDEADVKKIKFCQSESDFLTFLEVYKEWLEVPKAKKSHWCVLNCINAKSLRLAHELIMEIMTTLVKELNICISAKLKPSESVLGTLHEIIFYSFCENLCIFSGHIKAGYFSLHISENLHIHPSSSLYSLGRWRPQYIVYDTILKTSQTFLVNVTSVEEQVLQNAVDRGIISINDIADLTDLVLSQYSFRDLGLAVLKKIVGPKGSKLRIFEKQLQEWTSNNHCVVEADFSKCVLNVFVPSTFGSMVYDMFTPLIDGTQRKFLQQEFKIDNIVNVPCLSAAFGAGLVVKEVLLPGEYRSVIVTPPDCDMKLLMDILQPYGDVVTVTEGSKFKKVTFQTVASAQTAMQMLQNEKRFTLKPSVDHSFLKSSPTFSVLVHLLRRPCVGRAFINFNPPTSFQETALALMRVPIYYKSVFLNVSQSKTSSDLCIQNVPVDVRESELKICITKYLPASISVSKLVVDRKKPFQSSKAEIESMIEKIRIMFSKFSPEAKFQIDLKKPRGNDKEWQAIVYFDKPQEGRNAVGALKGSTTVHGLDSTVLMLKPSLESSLYCSKEIFSATKEQIEEAIKFYNNGSNETLDINAIPKNENAVHIHICSSSISDIYDASKTIQRFIQGDQIECRGRVMLEKLFDKKGQIFLAELNSKIDNVHIHSNFQSKVLSLFGKDSSCTIVKHEINKYLDSLEELSTEEISLKSNNIGKSILKAVVRMYGFDLMDLRLSCNLMSAEINVRRQVLHVTGDARSITQCKDEISKLCTELSSEDISSIVGEECPICCDVVTAPAYHLELCGHTYCEECVIFRLQNVTDIPVLCSKEGCEKPLVMRDILWAQEKDKALTKVIYNKAFEVFVKQSKGVQYCPTADCSMVFRVATDDKDSEITCPSCYNSICRRCCVLNHSGMSCNLYKRIKSDNTDSSLIDWMMLDPENHKMCPSCNSPIEKDGGCLHMTCWKCKSHICWRCMKIFPTGDDVYNHQPLCFC